MIRFLAALVFVSLQTTAAEEYSIPDDCAVLEGWVTLWIDQVRQSREEIINLKMDGKEPDAELARKHEYVTLESERFSKAFELRCDNQGALSP